MDRIEQERRYQLKQARDAVRRGSIKDAVAYDRHYHAARILGWVLDVLQEEDDTVGRVKKLEADIRMYMGKYAGYKTLYKKRNDALLEAKERIRQLEEENERLYNSLENGE